MAYTPVIHVNTTVNTVNNPCDYYSFIDPGGMEGCVDLVG